MKPKSTIDLDFEKLELDRARFNLEQQSTRFRYLTIIGAIIAFGWPCWTYFDSNRREQEKAAAVRKVAGMQPFLERQLKLFEEATQTASCIAVDPASTNTAKYTQRFWQLYWGELALVEHGPVSKAMDIFGKALDEGADPEELHFLSLDIAHACRNELAISWGEPSWEYKLNTNSPLHTKLHK